MAKKLEVRIRDATEEYETFSSVEGLLDFLKTEAKFWRNVAADQYPNGTHQFLRIHKKLDERIATIESWGERDGWSVDKLNTHIGKLNLDGLRGEWLFSTRKFTPEFIRCTKEHGTEGANSFREVLWSGDIARRRNMGQMMAYRCAAAEDEEPSPSETFDHLYRALSEKRTELVEQVKSFQVDFANWNAETTASWKEWFDNTKGARDEFSADSDQKFTAMSDAFQKRFDKLLKDTEKRAKDYEKTYKEKLRLAKPADYWKQAASKYRWQGVAWMAILVAIACFGLLGFYGFFTHWLIGLKTQVQLDTLPGLILFGSALGVFAFLLRVFSRLTFSSFHLMRDAEEREQLAHLFLSLVEEEKIDASSRDIVLQALFSRSETGLLNRESGPTMPVMTDFIEKFTKGK